METFPGASDLAQALSSMPIVAIRQSALLVATLPAAGHGWGVQKGQEPHCKE